MIEFLDNNPILTHSHSLTVTYPRRTNITYANYPFIEDIHNLIIEINNNIIFGNSAKWGGAIYNSGTVYIINSTIENNSSDFGGGVYVTGTQADLKVMNTIIWGNSAPTGPGIHVDNGTDSVVPKLKRDEFWYRALVL